MENLNLIENLDLAEKISLKDETKEAPLVVTNCKDCVFKIDGLFGQAGCSLNRLNKFEDKVYIEEDQSWRINRVCNTWRPEHWTELHKGENLEELVMKEVELKCSVIVRQEKENLDNISLTLKDLAQQHLKPSSVTLIVENKDIPIDQIFKMMTNVFKESNISWNFERILDIPINCDDAKLKEKLIDHKIWDKGISRSNGQYTMLCEGGCRISKNTLNSINKLLNYDLRRFLLIIPNKKTHKLVFQTKLWKTLGGFGTLGLIEKIKILEEEQNINMTINWKDLP